MEVESGVKGKALKLENDTYVDLIQPSPIELVVASMWCQVSSSANRWLCKVCACSMAWSLTKRIVIQEPLH